MSDIAERRDQFAALFTRPLPADVDSSATTLGGRPALELRRAAPATAGEDVLLYLHGGGFVVGSARVTAHISAALLRHLDGRVVSLDYRLAPEHAFPAAPDDCMAAYRELLDSGVDPQRLVVAGDSAGAALAVVTMMRARDAGLPMPAAAVLFSPAVDLTLSGASMRSKDGVDPFFAPADLKWLFDRYLAGGDGAAPEASPVFADLTGLPPLLIQVGSSELLLDDAVRLAGRAGADEVAVTLEVVPRQPHVFQLDDESAEAAAALERAGRFLATRLGGEQGRS
ncbi:alpha/beta hydrolase [Planomonospora parontospora]|uniref:alpha/beta hydrolase n=1 Tax=Planomonospora parontospora TaxID=58119 RepID=UPI00167115C6|nr:alpha/beta hydrolase [Planomonospora parontospora]GGL12303.1 alpha/beta hydrolase [Planomonospora parontospora subsp. antibiotica]GII14050.1 alpha/beta hydrolase [Planomonospora parontospora subsp. antibiotica]